MRTLTKTLWHLDVLPCIDAWKGQVDRFYALIDLDELFLERSTAIDQRLRGSGAGRLGCVLHSAGSRVIPIPNERDTEAGGAAQARTDAHRWLGGVTVATSTKY